MSFLIGVHVGAGYHSTVSHQQLCGIMKTACQQGLKEQDGMEACVRAIKVLEDSPLTNAGVGSSLTINGTVECDASVMSSDSCVGRPIFAGVGCIPDTKNPIEVAHQLWKLRKEGTLSLGRVAPILVAGTGAYEWALLHAPDANPRPQSNRPKHTQHGSPHENSPAAASSAIDGTSGMIVEPVQMTSKKESAEFELITDKNRQKWQRYHQAIEQEQFQMTQPNSAQEKYPTTQPEDESSPTLVADQLSTVGAVVVSMSGDVYAGVSSGGIWMKQPGRIGHVSQRGLSSANEISRSTTLTACKILLCHFVQGAIFGSGCSAANGIACSISGTGEDIIECLLAHQITSYTTNMDQMPSTSTTIRPSSPRGTSTKHSGIKRKEPTLIDGISNGAAAHSAKRHKQCLTESTLLAQSPTPSLSDRLRSCLDTSSLHSGLDAGIIAVEVKRSHHPHSVSSSAPIPLSVDLAWSHSTRHFGIGFMQNGGVPYAEISNLQDETTDLVKGLMPFNTNTEPTGAFSSTKRICTAGRKFQLN